MSLLRIGISANILYPDKNRVSYRSKSVLLGEESMYHWVQQQGAIAYMIPTFRGAISATDILTDIDALIISGGVDICPKTYSEEPIKPEWAGDPIRDAFEISLLNAAIIAKKPVLGICRGHQVINVGLGGSMYQDINHQIPNTEIHRDAELYDKVEHDITLTEGSFLSSLYRDITTGRVNSIHHQSIKNLGEGLKVQALSTPDNIIESVYLDDPDQFVLGTQWHPEWIPAPHIGQEKRDDLLDSDIILNHFLQKAKHRKEGSISTTPNLHHRVTSL